MNVRISKKAETLILIVLLFVGFLLRLYRFDSPIADWHSWRQADTSAVSRNFAETGFDLLHPKFDDLSNVPSGIDNPMGFRFVEFPIYNTLQAATYKYIGVLTLEQWGRLVTILASSFSAIFLYLIIKKRFGKIEGFFVAGFYLFLPFNIYYSRVILPDPTMVMAILGGTYFFQAALEKDSRLKIYDLRFIASLIFVSMAFLLKPYALFFTLPIIYLAYEKFKLAFLLKWQLWVFFIISLIPLVGWRLWILNFPQGIPVSNWLFNGNNIRFKPSFFYWIFYERIIKLILGFTGTILLIPAFLKGKNQNNLFFILSFAFSSLIYLFVLATGNVQHDYYQILIIPSLSIMLGIGAVNLFLRAERIKKYLGVFTLVVLIGFSFYFSWNLVKDYFNINNRSIIVAGKAVDELTPKNAKIIANYNGDTSFLYQTKRKGWASFQKGLPEMVQMGASYLVLVNPTAADLEIGKTYKIEAVSKDYVLFNLLQKP